MFKLVIIGLLLLCGCTSIKYSSEGQIPLAVGTKAHYLTPREVTGKKKFYLWGLYPNKHVVKIDKNLASITVPGAAKVGIEEYQTFSDFALMIISFGMYVPVSYKITCLTTND